VLPNGISNTLALGLAIPTHFQVLPYSVTRILPIDLVHS